MFILLMSYGCSIKEVKKSVTDFKTSKLKRKEDLSYWNEMLLGGAPFKFDISIYDRLAGLSHLWGELKYSFDFFGHVCELHWDQAYVSYISAGGNQDV